MSIHIAAAQGQVADKILLPGDPLRAKFIAENLLADAERFNEVRNMFGYTGQYKGVRVSVMGTGMGMPSLSIYVNELIRDYGVKRLIRVGTCGAMQPGVNLRDLIIAMSACTDSNVNKIRFDGMDYAPTASFSLLRKAYDAAMESGLNPYVGQVLSSDSFYTEDPEQWKLWARFGVLGVEMESAELYTLAAKYGVDALAILTVSDHLVKHEATSAQERQTQFKSMAQIALNAIIR
ncbi:MAG: purine-nucleoside phosphorylase [Spirochaetia bacterium]|jgi:purine-nucleoside phosphorylase|uniref:Purine nucleoside phosphorylase DeoD-type n=1 Tax=bioreactor metagenome TaxID=1076179 RepID=A0A644UI94_9ZZZZ|nr:purine-nucleoside phosphorylase [Spirochaetia bacterium]MCE1209206.1 purine-nucleoside phosphorylase [Spirochaetia bacterium]NLX46276.1 purine-nucleoside phosphorylase [Treponema sp.]HOI23875.1 purine-nucleoside phosphorylase [Spirochaetales bacterium]